LNVRSNAAADHQGRPLTLALRPEDIRLVRGEQNLPDNTIRTRINDIEFRGAINRFYLQVMHQAGGISEQTLEMDLQSDATEGLDLGVEAELMIQLPPDKLLLFPDLAGEKAA